ncbi:MAG: imidazole glycerol phosphate synthase subunit HisF [Clostridiales bacterium]|nr:imidazole glycerol phosphate synthase subunit HisF [Clostridiales bacterium]
MLKRPRLIPCLLLSDGNLVKTKKFKDPNYLGDPINAVKIFSEKCVDELCIQDIEASKHGKAPNFELLRAIASEAFMPLSYGGGITTLDQASKLFHIGFEKVILNSAFFDHPTLVTDIAKRFGVQSVAVSIDAKQDLLQRYRCQTHCGLKSTSVTPQDAALAAQDLGAGEILLNCINRDGMMQGYDLKLVQSVASLLDIPLIACGGAKDASDMQQVLSVAGAHAAAAGSMFVYFGPLKAVLIHVPEEKSLHELGIYQRG